MRKPTEYVLFEDEQVLAVGTVHELAELVGCRPTRIYQLASTPTKHFSAVRLDDLDALDTFATRHVQAMAEICSRIVRATRGRCRNTDIGCDWLGWCKPCYRGACQLLARKRGKQ